MGAYQATFNLRRTRVALSLPWLLALPSLACDPMPEASTVPPAEVAPTSAPIDVHALEQEVITVRRLTRARPVETLTLSDEDFRAQLSAHTGLGWTATRSRNEFWQTIGGGTLEASPKEAQRRVLEEQVSGIYDPRTKRLFVRDAAGRGERVASAQAATRLALAHEIVHALQDQHFDLGRGDDLNEDESLAYSALAEGDAVLTTNGVAALEEGTLDRWRSRMRDRAISPGEIADRGGAATAELRRAPSLLQRQLLFPYVEGVAFVLRLYWVGGFDLINKAFARPPQSTEQVLHIEKYIAGEMPVPVDWPLPPAGWQPVVAGRMGELQTGVILAQCLPAEDAALAATGWGGDAWAIVADSDRRTAMLWSTIWDDEASATRFERAARARSSCSSAQPLFSHVGQGIAVLREGVRVAYAQGFSEPEREVAVRSLLHLAFAPVSPQPPFDADDVPR